MLITKVESISNGKYKVYIDEQLAFALYRGELSRYRIKMDAEIAEEVYNDIITNVILKRGKARGLHLLEKMERTERQVRDKLRQNFYPEVVIDQVILYLKSYRYIDDERYCRLYIESKKRSKSIKQIKYGLRLKGIATETIEVACSQLDTDDEQELIRKLAVKKKYNAKTATREEQNKFYQFLMRRGLRYGDIQRALQSFTDTEGFYD